MEVFHALSGNNRHIDEIDDLYEGINNIQPNKRIPDIEVTNFNGEKVSLPSISKDRKTVFYFWSGANKKHLDDISNRIRYLTEQEPSYTYVGINVETNLDEWKSLLPMKGLDAENQYRSDNFEELTRALIVYPMNKCIIADNEMIVDAFGDIYRSFK